MAKHAVTVLDLKFQGRKWAIASYLLRHAGGAILIECGPGTCVAELRAALAHEGLKPPDITHVLLTHIHLDHAGAAGWWAQQGAEIIVHPVGGPHMLNPDRLLASAARIYGPAMEQLWGEFLPVRPDRLRIAQDGQQIEIGGLRLVPIDTPGHAEHHFAYLFEDMCFSGDIGGVRIPGHPYLRVPMPPPELHIERWRASLRRLQSLRFGRIAPTHFGVFEDPEWQLKQVEKGLDGAERWLEVVMRDDPTVEDLRERFTAWMAEEAASNGLSTDVTEAYALANPPGMSADGLERYWRKFKGTARQPPPDAIRAE
jgi:glyoxylase-like metal-dependent hydrolase (beta-lactamase superfamily II)